MAKRKREQPLALLPPLKRECEWRVSPRCCAPLPLQVSGKRKRKLEPTPSPESERLPPTDGSPAPSKKPRTSESQDTGVAADFQCQKDEAFSEYSSFHFWRTPLPDIDFSELIDEACDGDKQAMSIGTDVPEEMDN